MPLVLQLHLCVTMSKYSNFGVDNSNTFWLMGYIKDFAWQQQLYDYDNVDLAITIVNFFFEADKLKITL